MSETSGARDKHFDTGDRIARFKCSTAYEMTLCEYLSITLLTMLCTVLLRIVARKSRHSFIEEVILFLSSIPCVIRCGSLISAHVPKRPAPEINTLIPGTESPASNVQPPIK